MLCPLSKDTVDCKKNLIGTTVLVTAPGEHMASALIADCQARFRRLVGTEEVVFSTGTDEHGLKIQRAADSVGVSPQTFADRVSQDYAKVFQKFGVTQTHFVRTSRFGHQFNLICLLLVKILTNLPFYLRSTLCLLSGH